MICPTCGKELEDGSRFCIFCGSAVQADNGISYRKIRSRPGRETYPPRPPEEEVYAQDDEPTMVEEYQEYPQEAPRPAYQNGGWQNEDPGEALRQTEERLKTLPPAAGRKSGRLAPAAAVTLCTVMIGLAAAAVVVTVRNAHKEETLVASAPEESLQQSGALDTTEQTPLTKENIAAAENAGQPAESSTAGSGNTGNSAGSFTGMFADTGYGTVVGDGTSVYFWKYNSASYNGTGSLGFYAPLPETVNQLVRWTDGTEEVLLEDTGNGNLALVKGKIYYEKMDSSSASGKKIWCFSLTDGKTWECQSGRIRGITSDRSYVIGHDETAEAKLFSIRASDGHSAVIGTGAYYTAVHNDRLYYYLRDTEQHRITLHSADPDGAKDIELFSGSTNNWPMTYPVVAQIRFPVIKGTEYVYFSYGDIGGEGLSYQGGKVARVHPDGTGSEVLAGLDEDVMSDFLVNEDGTVKTNDVESFDDRFLELFNDGLNWYYVQDGDIYAVSETDGQGILLMSKEEYAFYSPLKAEAAEADNPEHLDVVSVDTLGNMVFVHFQLGKEQDVQQNWRTRYDLENGALLAKDLSTGTTAEYFRYTVGQ